MPAAATAQLLGKDHRDPAARKAVGYLPEGHRFPLYLTGRGVCQYFGQLAGFAGAALAQDIEAKLALLSMSEWADTRVSKYSKGMLQRLGLAQAMLGNPAIPFPGRTYRRCRPVGRYELRNVIRSIQAGGTTIFLNSHLLSEVEEICDEIAILHRGSIMQQGSVATITASVGGQGKSCLVTFTTSPVTAGVLAQLPATTTPLKRAARLSGEPGFGVRNIGAGRCAAAESGGYLWYRTDQARPGRCVHRIDQVSTGKPGCCTAKRHGKDEPMIRAVIGDTWQQSKQQVVFIVMLVVMLVVLIAGIALPRAIVTADGEKTLWHNIVGAPHQLFFPAMDR